MRIKSLSPRLAKIAELVRDGATVCDVGTDHAFLPCHLAQIGNNPKIYACDYNIMPLKTAEAEVIKRGFSDKITLVHSNGLEKIPPCDDIVIAGMGGELIAEIVENMPDEFKTDNLRLVLQPMTKQQILRDRLHRAGVVILFEEQVKESTKSKLREYIIMYCKLEMNNNE